MPSVFRQDGNGPKGPDGSQGPPGAMGLVARDGDQGKVEITNKASFEGIVDQDFLQSLLRQAEDEYIAEHLDEARQLLSFITVVASDNRR